MANPMFSASGKLTTNTKNKDASILAMIRAGQAAQAILQLRLLLQQDPENQQWLFLMYRALFYIRAWNKALFYLDKLLKRDPTSQVYLREQAKTLTNAKRYTDAIALTQQLLKDDKDIELFNILKISYYHLGQLEDAVKYGQQVMALKDQQVTNPASKKLLTKLNSSGAKIISYSLWGNNKIYQYGAMVNALLTSCFFPGWTARFYVSKDVSSTVIKFLEYAGAQVILAQPQLAGLSPYCWRFMVMNDLQVQHFLCRDCDSRLSAQEYQLIIEWLDSGLNFHVIRNNILHSDLMLAGLWGGTALSGIDIQAEATRYFGGKLNMNYGLDQQFLAKCIWPQIRNDVLAHDNYYRLPGIKTLVIDPEAAEVGSSYQRLSYCIKEAELLNIPRL